MSWWTEWGRPIAYAGLGAYAAHSMLGGSGAAAGGAVRNNAFDYNKWKTVADIGGLGVQAYGMHLQDKWQQKAIEQQNKALEFQKQAYQDSRKDYQVALQRELKKEKKAEQDKKRKEKEDMQYKYDLKKSYGLSGLSLI
jgi:hypothetical protein